MEVLLYSIVNALEGDHTQLLLDAGLTAVFSEGSEMSFSAELRGELGSAPLSPQKVDVSMGVDRIVNRRRLLL